MLPDRGFFAFTQTYDEFSGNIVVNSDLNCCSCLKIKKYLMSLLHLPTSANFHQDSIQVCRIQKFNMKCEIERMEINYTFYFFPFFEK